ncbi:MAG: acetyltransferase [Candidatus Thorarchaeota archaeon]|jgi:sugar O-acyltransferase (sialic acid O-acetyltransferase NeuD family)
MKSIVLLGGGKNCKVIIDIIEESTEYEIVGITDLTDKVGNYVFKYKIIGTDADLGTDVISAKHGCVTLGGDMQQRKRVYEIGTKAGLEFPQIISKASYISKYSEIGEGSIIMPSSIINPDTTIGVDCIINSGSIVEHDCQVGSHCHISPGAVLNGSVEVGDLSHIGANATVLPGIIIGSNAIVGAGSVVTKDIPRNKIVAGVPAAVIKKR